MQIQCPHCSATLQLRQASSGRYKPICKHCRQPFLMQVGKGDPPTIRLGKPRASGVPSSGEPQKADAGPQKTVAEQTIDVSSAAPPNHPVASVDQPPVSRDRSEISAAPSRLGGYRIIRMLGRGAMGAVYHARQVSLDRDVALKTIRGRLADNPASLARFTREAYAAAQLSHHNVVQIYDFGEDDGQHFFSMEWIRGGSLGDLVREKGSLPPKLAATYILQAARGLQFAHRNGMVHRDIKPANLLLSEDGVVKVADLGLVKIPDALDDEPNSETLPLSGLQSGTQVTMQGTAVGTPAYMAPEQSQDASTVDHRADIYSLGCSLFYLLTGRPPYDASLISEVMDQHAHAPLPDLAQINSRVPESLIGIVQRAMAKRPVDRYATLADMIDDLQSFLGVESLTGFSPSGDQADRWESIANAYAKTQRIRRHSGALTVALAAVAFAVTVLAPLVSLGMILAGPALFASACLVAIALSATGDRNAIADHLRRWVGSLSWIDLTVATTVLLVTLSVVLVTGLWVGCLVGIVVGAILGTAYHFLVTVTSKRAGAETLEAAQRFIRDLRIDGVEENGLRDFVARYAVADWQLVYESLFGYDALTVIRDRLAHDPTFNGDTDDRSLGDRLCRTLAAKTKANRAAADRKKLADLERDSLISQGVSPAAASEQSWQMASAIMESARLSVASSADQEKELAEAKRKRVKAMLADARSGAYRRPRDRFSAVKFAFSGVSRLLVGTMLLAIFAFSAKSQGLLSETMVAGVRSGDIGLQSLPSEATTAALGLSTSLWALGIAGLLLCLSAYVSGWRMTPFAVVATLVILFGANFGIPSIGPVAPWMIATLAGIVIYIPGVIYGEERE